MSILDFSAIPPKHHHHTTTTTTTRTTTIATTTKMTTTTSTTVASSDPSLTMKPPLLSGTTPSATVHQKLPAPYIYCPPGMILLLQAISD